MVNLLKAECYKLFHTPLFYGLLLLTLALSSVLLMDSRSRTGSLFLASLYNTPFLFFFTIVFGAVFVGNDLGERTLSGFICAGHRRGSILFIKTAVYLSACTMMLTVPLVLHGLLGVLSGGTGGGSTGWCLATGMTVLAAISAQSMLSLLFAMLFRDMGKAMAFPMGIFFCSIFILNLDRKQQAALVMPMGQLRLLSLRKAQLPVETMILADCFWIVFFYICSYLIFQYSDLK